MRGRSFIRTSVSLQTGNEKVELEPWIGDVRGAQIWGMLMLYLRHGRRGGNEVSAGSTPRTEAGINPRPCGR